MTSMQTEPLMFDNETLDVDEFLYDVSLHLRRKDIRTLLVYLGMPMKEIEDLLSEHSRKGNKADNRVTSSNGIVVNGNSSVNFLEQRKRAIRAWWFYAANTNLRTTPSQQKVKIVESRTTAIPVAMGGKEGVIVSKLTAKDNDAKEGLAASVTQEQGQAETTVSSHDRATSDDKGLLSTPPAITTHSLFPPVTPHVRGTPPPPSSRKTNDASTASVATSDQLPSVTTGSIVQIPTVEVNDSSAQTQVDTLATSTGAAGRRVNDENELLPNEVGTGKVAVNDNGVTLEDLLRKLWRCLQSCGLSRIVDELQQRWLIRINTKKRKADMFPKMTWGTPPPPQTPFTYPPYKRIGHMAVMGASIPIETRNDKVYLTRAYEDTFAKDKIDVPENSSINKARNTRTAGPPVDNINATSFPTRDAWKMRTDTVRRRGASLTAHVLVDHVVLPAHLVSVWGSSLHVTPHQMREKAARVFLNYVTSDGRDLCRAVDRIERIRGLVVENAFKRIVNGSLLSSSMDGTGSELVMQCRCLYPETVEQLWLWYQSGQLRESMQAGLVSKRVRHSCSVEQLQLRVYIAEEEYRRALGLLRRKPMPNTKTGRFYVTSASGGVPGGTSGLTRPQKQALMSVTKYVRLPAPSPRDLPHSYLDAFFPPGTGNIESDMRVKTAMFGGKPMKSNRALVDKILHKEVLSLRQRVRMCEDEWCEFAAHDLAVMLRCARNVMQRRVLGAVTREQLTPKCTSLSLLRALHKALISRAGYSSAGATPRGVTISGSLSNVHNNISLYPSDIAFASVDLVTSPDDDEIIVKARRQEERDFASAFAHFADLVAELSSCRNLVQDKIIARLTTNPTVAHSKQLYLTKDIYTLTERWRILVSKNFNIEHDPTVQLLAKQILTEPSMSTLIPTDLQEQFPGFIGLLPATFQVSDQVLEKLQNLLTSGYGASVGASVAYPTVTGKDGQLQTISVRVVA